MKCPYCGSERYKSLQGGVPRCCLKREKVELAGMSLTDEEILSRAKLLYPVSKVRGKWYKRGPINRILGVFGDLMSQPTQHGSDFEIHWSEHRIIIPAIVTLLDRCNWDEELAIEFMHIRFSDWFSYKKCQSFFQLNSPNNLSAHLSKAQCNIATRQEKARLQQLAVASTEESVNVFARTVDAM